jgi:hypothetical protein
MTTYAEAMAEIFETYNAEKFSDLRLLPHHIFNRGVSKLSDFALAVLKVEAEQVIQDIKAQLEHAYINGGRGRRDRSYRTWLHGANTVKRRLGQMIQVVMMEQRQRKKRERERFEHVFMDVARAELGDDQFLALIDKTTRRVDNG